MTTSFNNAAGLPSPWGFRAFRWQNYVNHRVVKPPVLRFSEAGTTKVSLTLHQAISTKGDLQKASTIARRLTNCDGACSSLRSRARRNDQRKIFFNVPNLHVPIGQPRYNTNVSAMLQPIKCCKKEAVTMNFSPKAFVRRHSHQCISYVDRREKKRIII